MKEREFQGETARRRGEGNAAEGRVGERERGRRRGVTGGREGERERPSYREGGGGGRTQLSPCHEQLT
jgi:hypothetical protein